MGGDAACARRLPLVFAVVLAVGCTTKVVNLAVGDGAAEKANIAREDASADREDTGADREDASVAPKDVSMAPEDASADREEADDASTPSFKEAYDAGVVTGPGYYVKYVCCILSDAGVDATNCTEKWLGGPEMCNSPARWKDRASADCSSMAGSTLTDYGLFGAC